MSHIETRHLRYFIAAAEEGSIIAASRALNITQPALSRQIQDLEGSIGIRLFERHAKGVQLTDAGLSFLQDAKQSLQELQRARDRAHRIAQGQTGTFKLGIMPSYLASPVTLEILQHFRERNPEILLSIEPLLSLPQAQAIRSEELDGGIMAWRTPDDATLSGITLYRETFVLAVPAQASTQATRPRRLADVAGEHFVWFDRERSGAQHSLLMAACARAGFAPHVVQIGTDTPTILGLVAAGMGCALVPASARLHSPPTVAFVALADLAEGVDIEFSYLAARRSPRIQRFIESVRHVAGRKPGVAL
ncbi:LysR substrate-binding domain-containing protein [Cupriavidus basilensis]|uniref:LysR substrate-binding domain-containing protein n=1 Tax=Cupriavidus basilensis TaxID=68895 RepID=A0ABT6AI20_9BURK|nr:LysR family transcriptional regulator [Cupriavidus basilensis]MDF3832252.1 LysR substrate-binding domain-containing protein [Cupriavidus basilensis]